MEADDNQLGYDDDDDQARNSKGLKETQMHIDQERKEMKMGITKQKIAVMMDACFNYQLGFLTHHFLDNTNDLYPQNYSYIHFNS